MNHKCLKGFPVFILIAVISLSACKGKHSTSLSGDQPVDISDFIGFFRDASLPVTVSDSALGKKVSDSFLISAPIFRAFVPDSVLGKYFGKSPVKIYALGKTREKSKETYLFIKAVQGSREAGYVICFSDKNQYLAALPLVRSGGDNDYTSAYGSLDKKFQITTYWERKNKTGEPDFKRNVYIYNNASNEFTLIVTEPGQEAAGEVQNPVDTFSQKSKYAGDYQLDKRNFISFRDSRRPSEILFFTHFEKDKGTCKGELKGTARFLSPKLAQYKEAGNPCTLQFTFNGPSVAMKEVEGCGAYRDIKCFFDGTYPRKKKKENKPNHLKAPGSKK